MVDVTLFEVHLDDSTLTANAPFSDRRADEAESSGWLSSESESKSESRSMSESDESGGSKLPVLVGLVMLVGIGLALRRFMGGSGVEDMGLEESELDVEA